MTPQLHSNIMANKTELMLGDRTTQRSKLGPLSEFGSRYSFRPGNAQRSPDHLTMACVDLPHNEGIMGTDSNPYAAIVLIVALKKRNIDLGNENMSEFADCKTCSTNFFMNHT